MVSLGRLKLQTEGKAVKWYSDNAIVKGTENSDLFRMHLDDGLEREITVYGKDQTGNVKLTENGCEITYEQLKAENGKIYDIRYTVYINERDGGAEFSSKIENKCDVRVNEVQLPFIDLNRLCDECRENDILLMPNGLGEKTENPWKAIQEKYFTDYFSADYNEIWYQLSYPFPASMGWFGIQSKDSFLYIARKDTEIRTCALCAGTGPKGTNNRLILTVSEYPVAIKGETITTGVNFVSLLDGDWGEGAKKYSEYARNNWYQPQEKSEWVRNCVGFQRITMKHQFGEIYCKYSDLPEIYKLGEKYGIKLLLLFGWWKKGMDNGYPYYEIDEELGGEKELRKAIKKIQLLGGKIALYGQGVLLDVSTDYYRETGCKISRKDIDGNDYREFYQFSNNGSLLRLFGHKTFASACQATDEWQMKLTEITANQIEMGGDMVFFDQIGGHIPRPCFDKTHKHGNRIDAEAKYRIENLSEIKKLCKKRGKAFGTENTVDVFCSNIDLHHGHMSGTWYDKNAYSQMFQTVFPEEIITNRLLHDDIRADFKTQMNYAFVAGLRFDVSIYRSRKATIAQFPQYGEYLNILLDVKEEYKDFFYYGKQIYAEKLDLPEVIEYRKYKNVNDELLYVLWNNSDKEVYISVFGEKIDLFAQTVKCIKIKK